MFKKGKSGKNFIGKEREKLVCNDACRILGIDFT